MAHLSVRTGVNHVVAVMLAASGGLFVIGTAPQVRADAVAYLVNVTVRPGYNFPNADTALAYGHDICEKVRAGRPYAQVTGDVKADFGTSDEYQASYALTHRKCARTSIGWG